MELELSMEWGLEKMDLTVEPELNVDLELEGLELESELEELEL